MKRIKSLMGRRQFLAGAVAASTAGLVSKKVAGAFAPGAGASVAEAAEKTGGSGAKGVFSDRYRHLLSPLKIGNVVLKSRMTHTRSIPHFLQGPETFPNEQVISYYAGVAKNGCAIVTCKGARPTPRVRENLRGDTAHMMIWHINDPSVQNYFSQLADAIHFYDSLASVGIHIAAPSGYNISSAPVPDRMGRGNASSEAIPVELMQKMIEETVGQAKLYQGLGFDMVNIYMPYRAHILAHALSPALNKRSDKYGGNAENRARFPLELFQAIKKACGPDFLIEAQISGEEPAGGFTIKDVVEYAKIWEGTLDILQLRGVDGNIAHPVGLNSVKEKPITLAYAEAVKKSGAKIVVAPVGGYQDPDLSDNFVASGKTDLIAMARAWICDSDYGRKLYEGRGEDVVPCIRCNDCHGISMSGPWYSWCSVNPKIGHAHRLNRMIDPPAAPKKVAVIGGGPAGMKAAIVAADRGHKVTLYEKNDFLGGQLRYSDFSDFKWPLKNFKDYLVRQLDKAGIEVVLKTRATPEMIEAKGYNAILVATGAEPYMPDIPGADGRHVRPPLYVYGNEKSLGKNVVVIGGMQIGVETGIHLARLGHEVTVMTPERRLATDANEIHYVSTLRAEYESLDNFKTITQATAKRIDADKVVYVDGRGAEKSIPADNVVIYAGRTPRRDEALKFYGAAERFFTIGDCKIPGILEKHKDGNVASSMRTAFAAASQI
jgi:2,4-dienoyl-CoA reductase-like NADH-dependent reductase (Old Yellow Enzyme family)/thioredoxin reductase